MSAGNLDKRTTDSNTFAAIGITYPHHNIHEAKKLYLILSYNLAGS